jgi:hypothetical protein
MSDNNSNPSATPAPAGQPDGGAPQGAPQTPAAGSQPAGGDKGAQTVSIPVEELNGYKMKAGRWDAHTKRSREDRRSNRRSTPDYNADEVPPALLDTLKEKDEKIEELSSTRIKLEVKDRVRDMLDGDEYKDLPPAIKRAVVRNPLGFAQAGAQTVEEAVGDIQDYLDDELDSAASRPASGGGQQPAGAQPAGGAPAPAGGGQTPPASGSGPSNPQFSPTEGIDGKIGTQRSTTVLQNILKAGRK